MTDEELIAGLRMNALWVTTHDAADRIEALGKEVARLKAGWQDANEAALKNAYDLYAAEAAAYDAAAKVADGYAEMRDRQIAGEKAKAAHHVDVPQVMRWRSGKVQSEAIASAIRALATPDQASALDRVRAEAEAEGMQVAARITRVEAEYLPISLQDVALRCETAILAAIPKEGV